MSNATYNGQWAGAMAELAEQVHLEDPTLEAEEGAGTRAGPADVDRPGVSALCVFVHQVFADF